MTTQRKRFTNNDIEIGIEYGIEWSTPKGSCRILERNNDNIVVEFLGFAFEEYKGILELPLEALNQYLKYDAAPKFYDIYEKVNA